jgi:heptaprenyl diphosphate synthase
VNAKWDNSVAILSGDFLFAKASELSADLGAEVTRLLARTIATVCDGQIRDVTMAGSLTQTEEGYTETIRRKTAALIATSCRLGGMLSEAPPDQVDLLERFGEVIGLGFQLSDDIMDVISNEDVLGKPPGQDLRQGVYTLPVIYALQDGPGGRELAALLEEGPPEGERLEQALRLVASDRALDHAREAVTKEVRRAQQLAEGLPDGAPRDALLHLAEYLAARCGADG